MRDKRDYQDVCEKATALGVEMKAASAYIETLATLLADPDSSVETLYVAGGKLREALNANAVRWAENAGDIEQAYLERDLGIEKAFVESAEMTMKLEADIADMQSKPIKSK